MAHLKLTSGEESLERELPSDGTPMTLGRAEDNSWPLDDQAASRRHAEIALTDDGYVLRDLGSSNGTWVNRSRVERHVLADGDEITIGGSTMVFSEPPTNEATVLVDMTELPDRPAPPTEPPPAPAEPPTASEQPAPAPAPAPPSSAEPAPPPPPEPPPAPAAPEPPPAPPAKPSAPVAEEAPAAPAVRRSSSARVAPGEATGWKNKLEGLVAAYTGWLATPSDPPRPDAGQPVGFAPRLGAYLIDAVILFVLMLAIMLPLTLIGALIGSKVSAVGVLFSLVAWVLGMAVSIAYLLVPWALVGVTPGKRLLGLKVVRGDGSEPLGWTKAALRMIGYMASGLLFCAGFIMIAFTEENRGLHDMIADTKVVRS